MAIRAPDGANKCWLTFLTITIMATTDAQLCDTTLVHKQLVLVLNWDSVLICVMWYPHIWQCLIPTSLDKCRFDHKIGIIKVQT